MTEINFVEFTEEQEAERAELFAQMAQAQRAVVEEVRRNQYQLLCDPLFFGFQRGDNTEQEWLDAVQAVKDANPYPESPSA